jgi:hypothetical protein
MSRIKNHIFFKKKLKEKKDKKIIINRLSVKL